ncbi:MAG: GH25 family lysozyme [Candidatus Cryptobacteroides sp.]|nr:GH25 family lysozyme [Candidatus Cryptobacteroides sp.]
MAKSARQAIKRGKKSSKKHKKNRTISFWWILSPVLVCIGISLVIAVVIRCRDTERGASVPKGSYDYAVDISKYQKDVNWDSLMVVTDAAGRTVRSIEKAASIHRVRYVMIKATEGERHVDRLFTDHWEKSAAAGYGRGAYHFYRSSKPADRQALNFIRTVGLLRHSDLAPILDVETVHRGCSREQLNAGLKEWLATVEGHYRRKPILYTSDSFLKDWICPEIVENYPVWIARYSDREPEFRDWVFWQFTDGAAVYGIPSLCDLSVVR